MTRPLTFDIQIDQNEYLPAGGSVMDAAISVTARGEAAGPAPTAAQVIMIDSSGSMSGPKMIEAKRATAVAVETLRDGVAFAVVAGTEEARMVFPPTRTMVPATDTTRAQAKEAVRRLDANGGTAIGTWLERANELLADEPAEIKHGILLTDGHNEHQTAKVLTRTLERCRGNFVCDCRGIGTGWEAEPLLAIADVLHGSAKGLTEPSELAAEFRAITEALMGKAAANVALRLWTLPAARIRFLKQVYPRIVDLTERGTPLSAREVDFPTGQWGGGETRDFHVALEIPAGTPEEEPIRIAKVSVVVDGGSYGAQPVKACWTEDPALSTKINARVAHYSGQAELAEVIREGLAARASGDDEVATAKLGRAVQLAEESGHLDTLLVLTRVVDVVDAPSGTVRLRRSMEQVDAEMAETASRMTVRVRALPATRVLPVAIYLADEGIHVQVEAAVEELLSRSHCRIEERDLPVLGSWLRRMRASTTEAAVVAAHAAESYLVLQQDAEVTAKMLQNLGPVITALQPTKDAVIRCGALLIVKVDGVLAIHQLTARQQLHLDHEPQLVAMPRKILAALEIEPGPMEI